MTEREFRQPDDVRLTAARRPLSPALWLPPLAVLVLMPFPPLEWAWSGWVGLVPLLLALLRAGGSARQWFLAGWGFGIIYFALHLSWGFRTLVTLGGMGLANFAGFAVLMVCGLGLLTAAGIVLARLAWVRWNWSPCWLYPVLFSAQHLLLGVFPFGGFAWGSLAATQTHTLAAAMAVPVFGGPGLVLVMGLVNGGWAWLAHRVWNGSLDRRMPLAVLALLGATLLASLPSPSSEAGGGRHSFSALLLPGDFSIAELNAGAPSGEIVRHHLARTMGVLAKLPSPGQGKTLVIWPESSARGNVEAGGLLEELSRAGGLLNADILLGSTSRFHDRDVNSAYLVRGGETGFSRYDKRNLVPFGEYVPVGFGWLFGKKITSGEEDYLPGLRPPVLNFGTHRLGLAICFESILPGHTAEAVRQGAGILVVIANDAWLTGAAARHHLQLTALRGLETGREVLMVSNRGWSGLVRNGRLVRGGRSGQPLWVEATVSGHRTPWVRWGPWPLLALLCGVSGIGYAVNRGKTAGSPFSAYRPN